MTRAALILSVLAVTVSACATTPEPTGPADYREIVGQPLAPDGRLYVDCLKQAAEAGRAQRGTDGEDAELILFTCDGAPAKAFFDALGPWSAEIGSAFLAQGRSYRSTARVQRNLFGVDHCSARDGVDHRCVLSFNAGDFLRPRD